MLSLQHSHWRVHTGRPGCWYLLGPLSHTWVSWQSHNAHQQLHSPVLWSDSPLSHNIVETQAFHTGQHSLLVSHIPIPLQAHCYRHLKPSLTQCWLKQRNVASSISTCCSPLLFREQGARSYSKHNVHKYCYCDTTTIEEQITSMVKNGNYLVGCHRFSW